VLDNRADEGNARPRVIASGDLPAPNWELKLAGPTPGSLEILWQGKYQTGAWTQRGQQGRIGPRLGMLNYRALLVADATCIELMQESNTGVIYVCM